MGYRGKTAEQARARELRAEAWTLNEIAAELGVSKSSVSLWVRDVPFTPKPRVNLPKARNRPPNALQRRKQDEIDRLRVEGLERIGRLSERDLLIAGTALYAGEGSKRDGMVSFVNTNPAMVRLFCEWLRSTFVIDESRLRVRLYLHEGLDLEAAGGPLERRNRHSPGAVPHAVSRHPGPLDPHRKARVRLRDRLVRLLSDAPWDHGTGRCLARFRPCNRPVMRYP